jgi:GNAT superfamily N-acetyltransferase
VDDLSIEPCRLSAIQPLRELFLQEINAQVRYDAAHTRRGTAHYRLGRNGRDVGYGAVKDTHEGRGSLFEFYLVPAVRPDALKVLGALVRALETEALECQTNDRFYASLVQGAFGPTTSDTILYGASTPLHVEQNGATFRLRRRADRVFRHEVEPVGDFVVDVRGEVVATGGFLLHYNPPFADVFMEVRSDARRRGYGAFLVNHILSECYLAGRVPAARTSVDNIASQRTLLRAGLIECGRMLRASIEPQGPSQA